jgi:predicted DNA-binding transcriptional regulator AlpA
MSEHVDPRIDCVRSLKETAEIANLSVDTLRRLIASGRGPRVVRLSARKLGVRDSDRNTWLSNVAA